MTNFDLANALWPQSAATTEARPEYLDEAFDDVLVGLPARVILYNDNHHTLDEVVFQLCRALGCGASYAEGLTWEVHTVGKAAVYAGDLMDCIKVSSILEEIALNTQVET